MMRRTAVVALGLVVGLSPWLARVPAHAASSVPPTIVAGPGALFVGYATTTVTFQSGAALTFTNADFPGHNVMALDTSAATPTPLYGPDTPECAAAGDKLGQCPLFWTATIGPSANSTPVNGTQNLVVGKTYSFYCTVHPFSMRGTITVTS